MAGNRARLVGGVLALCLVGAACGGDDSAAETTTTTTAAAKVTTSQAATGTSAMADKDIVDTAVSAGNFTTLVTALKAANLADTLKGSGPFTVFAPTDDAFKALPAGTLDALIKDVPKLTEILKYHVVSGNVAAADVVKLTKAPTLAGKDVSIEVKGSDVILNGKVKVIKTDIKTKNGVIHVIDAVLIPS